MDENKTNEEHGCGDDCGCGEEHQMMKIVLDDGTEVEWIVLEIFEVEGKEYIALLPEEGEDIYIYSYKEDDEGVELGNIEEDEEFEKVGKALDEILEAKYDDEE